MELLPATKLHTKHAVNLSPVGVTSRRLPGRIRPNLFAFGTLADGFLPFLLPDGSEETLDMTSVVMKAVQARLLQQAAM